MLNKIFMYIFGIICLICTIAGCFKGYHHQWTLAIITGIIIIIIYKDYKKQKDRNNYYKGNNYDF